MKITTDGRGGFDNFYEPHVSAVKEVRCYCGIALVEAYRASGMTQAQFAELICTTQPRVSKLVRGMFDDMSIDWMIGALRRAGVEFSFSAEIPGKKEG